MKLKNSLLPITLPHGRVNVIQECWICIAKGTRIDLWKTYLQWSYTLLDYNQDCHYLR